MTLGKKNVPNWQHFWSRFHLQFHCALLGKCIIHCSGKGNGEYLFSNGFSQTLLIFSAAA